MRQMSINRLWCALALAVVAPVLPAQEMAQARIFELRTYTTNEGKLEALQARFRDHTMTIFEKHGMQNVGYWVPVDQPDTLIYLISHASRAAADESWQAFSADPQWRAAYQASVADGRLVKNIDSVFMTATDYSP
jgi:hypothetical protein